MRRMRLTVQHLASVCQSNRRLISQTCWSKNRSRDGKATQYLLETALINGKCEVSLCCKAESRKQGKQGADTDRLQLALFPRRSSQFRS